MKGKNTIKLNESQLKKIVAESVKRVLNESTDWSTDGALRYQWLNKKRGDNFSATPSEYDEMGQVKPRKETDSFNKLMKYDSPSSGRHSGDYEKDSIRRWKYGFESINKLDFELENLVMEWEVKAHNVFGFDGLYDEICDEYADYVKNEISKAEIMKFSDWYENTYHKSVENLMTDIRTNRKVYRSHYNEKK